MLETPILFIVFNRPETTEQVFEAIRQAKPKQLFVAADGPRLEKPGEAERCERVRKIATNVDWDCEVKTLFRDKNIGCGKAPAEAITWFFEHVEQGIILEDDCLPNKSFFHFCEELLEKYKTDDRIHSIAGTNLLRRWNRADESYFFSLQSGIWGWATWRRAWKDYDYYVRKWEYPEVVQLFKSKFENPIEREMYVNALNKTLRKEEISWWDYQWMFNRISSSKLGIIPSVNLISNIGFGEGATHTKDANSINSNIPTEELVFPLISPKCEVVDRDYDLKLSLTYYPPLPRKTLISKAKSTIKTLYKNAKKNH